jgi:hypothetical protein
MHTKFRSDILKGKDHIEDLGIDDRIILECILKTHTVFDRSSNGIVCSNTARVMDMCVGVFLCYAVLCRQRHCVGLIPRPRSLTECPK